MTSRRGSGMGLGSSANRQLDDVASSMQRNIPPAVVWMSNRQLDADLVRYWDESLLGIWTDY